MDLGPKKIISDYIKVSSKNLEKLVKHVIQLKQSLSKVQWITPLLEMSIILNKIINFNHLVPRLAKPGLFCPITCQGS